MAWKAIDTVTADEKHFLVLCEGKLIDFGTVGKTGEVVTVSGAKPYYWLSYRDLPAMPEVPERVVYDHLD
jgi:hypothetical protein